MLQTFVQCKWVTELLRHCVGFQRHKFSTPKIESAGTKKSHAFWLSINVWAEKLLHTIMQQGNKIATLVPLKNLMRTRVMCREHVCSCKFVRSLYSWKHKQCTFWVLRCIAKCIVYVWRLHKSAYTILCRYATSIVAYLRVACAWQCSDQVLLVLPLMAPTCWEGTGGLGAGAGHAGNPKWESGRK